MDKGLCYENAWRFLIKEEEGELIHGSVIGADGKTVNHAWVELPTGYVWEPESKDFFKTDIFYSTFKPKVERRYTLERAAVIAVRTRNFGPWTEEEVKKMEHGSNPGGTEVYVEVLPKCDFCKQPATYNAKTTMGPWAYMCQEHYLRHGIGLGTGKGQKLIPRKALGEAEKIRGEPPKELSYRMTEADLEAATLEDMWYPVCPYCGASTPAEPDARATYCQACNRRFKIINPFFLREPSLLKEVGVDQAELALLKMQVREREERKRLGEQAKIIAEEAAVKAVLLQGNQIAQQVAKELSGEVLHQSPLSTHCLAVLEAPPKCFDFRGIRSFVMCRAWDIMEKEKRTKLPVGEAWSEARRVCARE